ncbi:hypothetical protein L0Y69_01935 [bacterium]|nr:hypothetical protein [bacterium]
MIFFNAFFSIGIIALIALGVFYALKRWSGVNLFTKTGLVYLAVIIGTYILAPFLYKQCTVTYQDKIYTFLNSEWTLLIVFGIGILLVLVSWVRGSLLNKEKSILNKIISFLVLGVLILFLSYLYYAMVINPYGGIGGGAAHIASGGDRRRHNDLRGLQLSLELYLDKNEKYPSSLSELAPDFISKVPTDYATNEPYDYRVSADQKTYVLKTIFGGHEQTCRDEHYLSKHNIFLGYLNREPDLDGNILGLDCNDPAYCIGPY